MLNGDFTYEFALWPFTGDWRQADLHRRALEYNYPVVSLAGTPGPGTLGEEVQPLEPAPDNIILSAFYPEAGRVLARFYECQGRADTAPLSFAGPHSRFQTVDLLGRTQPGPQTPQLMQPCQIRTVRLNSNP